MIRLTPLLIWACFCIGGAASAQSSQKCFKNIDWPGLKSDPSNTGWNGLGKGFLDIFTPAQLTDEHWQIIGRMKQNFEAEDIQKLAFSMGGLIFLTVVGVLLMCLFCAAPCALCVFSCTCKKKCKPKSNKIVTFSGIACNSVAMLTIFLGILFCFLSISSFTSGIGSVGTSIDPLPQSLDRVVTTFKEQLKCSTNGLVGSIKGSIGGLPETISAEIVKNEKLKKIMEIDFTKINKDMEGFVTSVNDLSAGIEEAELSVDPIVNAETDMTTKLAMQAAAPQFKLQLQQFKTPISEMETKLTGQGSIKEKLADVEAKSQLASKTKIEELIREKIKGSSEQINNVAANINQQIDTAFSQADILKKEATKVTKEINAKVDIVKEYLGYGTALNLVLFPCYLALVSAIWSTMQATKFVQKKKPKPKEKGALLIPIAIGFGLAFIPLLFCISFMMSAGVANVACNTVFGDESLGFLPHALTTFDVGSKVKFGNTELDIATALGECKSGKSVIAILKGDALLGENMVMEKFDLAAKKAEMTANLDQISFGLPSQTEWDSIKGQFTPITAQMDDATNKIDAVNNLPALPDGNTMLDKFPKVKAVVDKLKIFLKQVEEFKNTREEEIEGVKQLDEGNLKADMKKMILGDGAATPPTDGLLKEMLDNINGNYTTMRKAILTESTNCGFLFALFKDIGTIVCDQATGGLNGIYAAIGLAVLSFFSAAVGTVLIWHSLRAGINTPPPKSSDDSKKKKKKGKKGEGEGGEGGDEEGGEEDAPPEEGKPSMEGKIGEQAEPMKIKPQTSSEPTPPQGNVQPGGGMTITIIPPPGVAVNAAVQAVPTDPAVPGEKTNPSLLPNDDQLAGGAKSDPMAGTPVSPNPIQMVNMEMNNQDNDKQNSITGAGGGTTAQ